jgi:hypothetical protein
MDVIRLAALPSSTPIIIALRHMSARKQLGVICVQPDNSLYLAKAEDIGRSFGNKETLGEVEGLIPVPTTEIEPEHHFRQISTDYILKSLFVREEPVGEASVVTRHEIVAQDLKGDPSRPSCSCNTGFHNIELYVGMICPKHGCPVT